MSPCPLIPLKPFLTFKVAVGIKDPPDPPTANSNLPSLSIMTGVMDDKGRLPGAKRKTSAYIEVFVFYFPLTNVVVFAGIESKCIGFTTREMS